MTTTNEAKHLLLNLPLPDFQTDAERGEYWAKIDKISAALCVEKPAENEHDAADVSKKSENVNTSCPTEYQGEGGFFAYDFMPQKIMFKTDQGDMTALDVLIVRGWGHLIGGGGLGLPTDVAAKIQDNFGKWVVETLNAALTRQSESVGDRDAAYEALRTLKARGHRLPHCEDYQNALHTLMDFVDAAPPEPVQKHTLPSREKLAQAIYEAMQLTNYRSGLKRVPFCNLKKHERWLFNDCMEAADAVRALIGGEE